MLSDENKSQGSPSQEAPAPEASFVFSKDAVYGSVIAILACLLVISVFTSGFGIVKAQGQCELPDSGSQVVVPDAGTQTGESGGSGAPAYPTLTVKPGYLPAEGSDSAKVVVVEFSDYQCPYCARFYADAEAKIRTNYVESGKVRMYFRDFPLSFHPNAMPGAVAATCAADQGKFWEMHDKLFETQSAWSGISDVGPTFKQYAADLGLDPTAFGSCYDAAAHASDINKDLSEGQTYGVRGTPSSFIVIPKSMISQETLQGAMDALWAQYGEGISVYEDSTTYSVMIPGAYPYATFDTVLSKISY